MFSSWKRKGGGELVQRVRQTTDAVDSSSLDTCATQFCASSTLEYSSRNLPAASRSALPERTLLSSVTYQATQPCADATIMEVVTIGASPHTFAATITSEPKAHGGEFLRRNLHRELQSQVTACRGNVPAAFKATLVQLDLKFRALHIYNSHVLDGTHIAAAYVDHATATLHLASNGGCRAVVATRDELGRSEVTLELGRPSAAETAAAQSGARQQQQQAQQRQSLARPASASGLQPKGGRLGDDSLVSMPLTGDVESIILGSAGLWRELPAQQAALRVATAAAEAPHAMGGSSAALLAQTALQAVATRVSKTADPRMAVLRDPATLQQLWTGSKRNYKWGGRQPLRRRRGDVHGDLSAVVIRFDWAGASALPPSSLMCKKQAGASAAVPRSASGTSIASAASFGALRAAGRASHWDAVRAHFVHFRPAATAAARARWYAAVEAALADAAQRKAAAALAEAATAPAATVAAAEAPAAAGGKHAAAEKAVVIQAVATIAAPLTAPQQQQQQHQQLIVDSAEYTAAAEERAARRRALATTSYRRLGAGSSKGFASMRGTLQQLSVH